MLNHLQLVCGRKRILNFITRLEVFRHYCVMPRVKYVRTLGSTFYYTYVPQEYDLKVEPTPVCQILTDCQDGTPLIWCFERFMKQEQKHYGFRAKTVPPLFICDVSWPNIKTALKVFNNETSVY